MLKNTSVFPCAPWHEQGQFTFMYYNALCILITAILTANTIKISSTVSVKKCIL
jgi:hypothetical protein